MKKLIIFVLFAVCFQLVAQNKPILEEPQIDKRVELLSIVFRLAGRHEYSEQHFKLYTDRIEEHFGKYKDHELIRFTKSIIDKKNISYNAVMSMAVHLDDDLSLKKDLMGNSLEYRWKGVDLAKYTKLLKQFYKETNFDAFFAENNDLYTVVKERFLPVYKKIDLNWYTDFFGVEPQGKFFIINGVGNGDSNYGAHVNYKNGKKDIYSFMGLWSVDDKGMPLFEIDRNFVVLIHEFNHSYINHLIDKNREGFKKSGEQIFPYVQGVMKKQAYPSWEVMMYEALVRACVIKYLHDHNYDQEYIENQIKYEKNRGFVWIDGLVSELNKYDSQRDTYPTLEDYMPPLMEAYETYAKNMAQFESKRPKVVSINEFSNNDTDVSPEIKTITINFNRQLAGHGFSIYLGNKGKDAFPKLEDVVYANNNQSIIMTVSLEKNKEYQFILKGDRFVSLEGVGLEDYEVNFTTGK